MPEVRRLTTTLTTPMRGSRPSTAAASAITATATWAGIAPASAERP
jgi:hypothetical protein